MDINGGGRYGGKGGGGGRRAGPSDLYRHIPKDMTESTKLGVIMSFLSILTMIVLFICETWAFSHTKINSTIDIVPDAENLIRVNFNVTLFDIQCDFVSVDVWDTLGTNLQNVTKDITKWSLDEQGQKKKYHGRNKPQRALTHEEHKETTIQDIADPSNGGELQLHSTDLTPDNRMEFYNDHPLAMVDFFAPWCIWCQRLAPTWEKFAVEVETNNIHLGLGKVDCVEHAQLCKDERVMAFPTLRWYENGKAIMPDYRGDRTVEALMQYAKLRVDSFEADDDEVKFEQEEHHPGCQISGHLMVNRVPGNLHMEAKSLHHEINSAMTNLTHRVNHLSFGTSGGPQGHHLAFMGSLFGSNINNNNLLEASSYSHVNPMKDKYYPTYHFHESYHHHLKIISTHMDLSFSKSLFSRSKDTVVYQILEESQLVLYDVQDVPEIKFLWDMSPMGINLTKEGRRWYEYTTNLLAIIGGTYTTLGLINATLLRIFKPKRL